MRRIALFLAVCLCCLGLCVPVLADSALSSLENASTVHSDGSCSVVIRGDLIMEQNQAAPAFPVPDQAKDITLNGQEATCTREGSSQLVSLASVTGGSAGQFHFTIGYTLPTTVQTVEEAMTMELPLLRGFAYPVEQFAFTITLPGEITQEPVFTSSYYQEGILSQIDLSVQGSTISGTADRLKDHETLTVQLPVDETLFPQTAANARMMGAVDIALIVSSIVVIGYFLITMLPPSVRRIRRATAPDGISAGDLPLWLSGRGMDLSLLVVTWAQLGYLRIQVDDSGRVLLHKRMDMGNERSDFENQTFRALFGRRRIVDGTGYHYATLCRSLRSKTPRIREIYRRHTGNPKLLRFLALIPALLSGITLATGFSQTSVFLRVLLAMVTTAFAPVLQSGGSCILTRRKTPLWISILPAVIWLVLGLLSGTFVTACLMILLEYLVGMGIAYGGRRTELGQQAREQILGLRRHMRKVSKQELQSILKSNPGYFYHLAPYALAMNTDRVFARRFARLRLVECTYLVSGMRGQMTAAEWAKLLRTTVQTLDHKADRLPLERLTGR